MANYDFSTLSSSDLEDLACDLLNAQERARHSGIVLKTFKDGKDKGIDLLYSTEENPKAIVGQVKHYFRSGFDAMLRVLKDDEKAKVQALKPGKYIFVTSVDLSILNQEEIKEVFTPYIKALADVYGKKDLNHLLDTYPDVLKNHFKLWFSGTEVLQRLLHYHIDGRLSEFTEYELKKRLRLYVITPVLKEVMVKLVETKFVIITGEPGSGKTTTAEMVLYDLIKDGYELVYIYDDIKEAEHKLTEDPRKQVFYYDDFLGHNAVEMTKAKGSETTLLKLLRRISHLENKRFILTTRTFILNTALEESERLRQFNIKTKASEIKLAVYDKDIRRQLLLNHIEESSIPEKLKDVLRSNKIISFIVEHGSFSPRSIEFITANDNIGHFHPAEYKKFIIENFNTPDEIWRHAYEQQITSVDRFLLNTMISFGSSVNVGDLETAFYERLNYEVEYNNYERPLNAFRTSFRRIEGGFIIAYADELLIFKFINPSLVDFLIKDLQQNRDEVRRISESSYFVNQLTSRLFPLDKEHHDELKELITPRLKDRLLNSQGFFIKRETQDFDRLILSILIHKYIEGQEGEAVTVKLLSQINRADFIADDGDISLCVQYFLEDLESCVIKEIIKIKAEVVLLPLFYSQHDLEDLMNLIKYITEKYKIDAVKMFQNDKEYDFGQKVTDMLSERIEEDIEDLLSYTHAQDFVAEKEHAFQGIFDYFASLGLKIGANLNEYSAYDWFDVGMDNYFSEQMRKDD